ncbi:ORF4 [Porcine circovirus 2]|uniref:ORF4 n=1 Tax=Porcine circovirus 2 TaxID=85708 RepID=Q918R9_PCV2|nr:ORF4 [Porcine circovirus 2]
MARPPPPPLPLEKEKWHLQHPPLPHLRIYCQGYHSQNALLGSGHDEIYT